MFKISPVNKIQVQFRSDGCVYCISSHSHLKNTKSKKKIQNFNISENITNINICTTKFYPSRYKSKLI